MDDFLLAPPVAFAIYVLLVAILSGFGRVLAGAGSISAHKTSTYAGGEPAPTRPAVPGYRPFFVVALFFAVLHLGVLVVGSGDLSPVMGIYLVGLILALVALIAG